MTEQEIVTAEELHRYRNDVVFHDLVMRFRGYVDGGLGKFEDIIAAANFGRKIHFANENCDYEAAIRSLPVPSEPSGEEQADFGGWDSEEQRQRMLLAAAEDMLLVEEQRRAKLDREITTLRTALREQAEVLGRYANEDNWVAIGDEHCSKDFWNDGDGFTLAQEVLSRHSGLLDGAPKKENERDAQSRS